VIAMNLKNRFRLVIFSMVALMVSIAVIMAIGIRYTNVHIQQAIGMDDLIVNLHEMQTLNSEYVATPSERVKQQWRTKYEQIKRNLVGQQNMPDDVADALNGLHQIFERLTSLPEAASGIDVSQKRLRDQLAITLNLESQRIIDWASDISRQTKDGIVLNLMLFDAVILAFILVAMLLVITIILITTRHILSSINRLKEGAEQISSGKLGFQVEQAGDDEIATLATAINRMSLGLMDSYESLQKQTVRLETEMAERQMIHEALRIKNVELEDKIGEHKLAQEETRELLQMLESVPNGIVVHDDAGNFLYANQRACDMHGYSPDEFMALSLHRITVPASEKLVDTRLQGLFDRGEISFEVEHLRKDGTILPLWINVKKATWGGKNVFLSVQTDLTERKRAEEEIGRMALILDTAPNSITVHDFDGRFLYANRKTFALHGFNRDEFLARNLRQLDVPESEKQIASNMQELLNRGEATFEVSHYRRDGSTLPMEVSARVTTWGDKKVILSIATDITERKRMEEDLLRARKLESLAVLADGIAHDFNNLMAIVQGYLDLALTDLPPDHVSRQPLYAAIKIVKQTKDLTRRLIAFSRGGAPHREIRDIAEIIRNAVHRTVKGTKIIVKLDLSENLWPAEVDELQMKQCFYNLTSNAVEAMPEGGNLTIQVENARISTGEVFDLKEGSYLKITFTDEGVGIPEDHFSKIFDPYFTTKRMVSQKGLGLGLSVCYSVLKNHDGHITVKSEPGEGTSFALYLPARADLAKRKSN